MALHTLFRFVEIVVETPSGGDLTFSTDLPGAAMTVRASGYIPPTTGRAPYRITLPPTCRGKLYELQVVPAGGGVVRIYAAKVYARALGPVPTPWAWYPVPVLETPVDWQPLKLPILGTSEDWQPQKLPIPGTSEDWSALPLPVKGTPVVPEWIVIPVDQ